VSPRSLCIQSGQNRIIGRERLLTIALDSDVTPAAAAAPRSGHIFLQLKVHYQEKKPRLTTPEVCQSQWHSLHCHPARHRLDLQNLTTPRCGIPFIPNEGEARRIKEAGSLIDDVVKVWRRPATSGNPKRWSSPEAKGTVLGGRSVWDGAYPASKSAALDTTVACDAFIGVSRFFYV